MPTLAIAFVVLGSVCALPGLTIIANIFDKNGALFISVCTHAGRVGWGSDETPLLNKKIFRA